MILLETLGEYTVLYFFILYCYEDGNEQLIVIKYVEYLDCG